MNEWEFTAQVAGWLNEIFQRDRDLPFGEARCEQKERGSKKRRDLTILDRNKAIILTGEIKLPYQVDGSSPYVEKVVQDARKKAIKAKTEMSMKNDVRKLRSFRRLRFLVAIENAAATALTGRSLSIAVFSLKI